ncbi:Na/Pi cotransporter family protein [Anaerolentibacter hominis]|uniref:Na/Pi cotransporter family protein n=1 Tax=Anaerolentibacter hominis TaxID=3079009 RepID=UPI0031B80CDB
MSIELLKTLFSFIGGLGLFLYGMNTMADGLQKSAGNKMKRLMGFLTNNRFLAVIVGALITAIIQSSSATTVMIVGFVNAGIMNLTQAVGVIMGANIGTTITAWIVSMSEWSQVLSPDFLAPLIVGIGAFCLIFTKKPKSRQIGEILIGFGVLFIGLSLMSSAIKPYRDSEIFVNAFRVLGSNPILGILTGAVVTAIIQSSSASVGILQTLALNGIVNWNSAVFITLGQNIGTCVTALISSAGAQKTAKRAAVIHLLFNVFGAVFFGLIMFIIFRFNPAWASGSINTVQISIFHTIFNITNTIILFPFAKGLVKLSGVLLKDKKTAEAPQESEDIVADVRRRLDTRVTHTPTPAFAIEAANREVIHMASITYSNFKDAVDSVMENSPELVDSVLRNEQVINQLEKLLTEYLVQIDNMSLTEYQYALVKDLFYTIHDLERIGDHSENLAELAKTKIDEDLRFSMMATEELNQISGLVLQGLENAIKARKDMDAAAITIVQQSEKEVDDMEDDLRERHIFRLSNHECLPESGIIFLDAITNLERVSDHSLNIAEYVQSEL